MEKKFILFVDDDPEMRKALLDGLSHNGYSVSLAESANEALRVLDQKPFDLVVTDVKMPGQDGFHLLNTLKAKASPVPVIMMTGFGTIQNAVEAMRKGAFDYLVKPFSIEALEKQIERALAQNPGPGRPPGCGEDLSDSLFPIITRDQRMKEVLRRCKQVAGSKATVLIQGESGTGKELFARYIHAQSSRREGPFVAVNCASLPEPLFESELFGHEKGAFTGALNRKIGKFELAHQGTILLDEISEMSTLLQAKILRVLQENEVDRIGGREPVPVDIRVIATTNRNLEACLEKGEFREDLYYRLNVIPIKLPPLRERSEDVELLTHYFMEKFSSVHERPIGGISGSALDWLKRQPWRGNVRELKNRIERAVLMTSGTTVDLEGLCEEEAVQCRIEASEEPLPFSLREMEKNMIYKALEKTNGNRTHAADLLGISIRTLRNKLQEYKGNPVSAENTGVA
jgi:DNA-binding NtrC family response regulator